MLLFCAILATALAAVAYSSRLHRRTGREPHRIQRRYTRIPVSLPVEVAPVQRATLSSTAQNISVDGMLVARAAAHLRVAEPVHLSFVLPARPEHLAFVLPQELPVAIPGVVWRLQGDDAVVRFDPTHPERRTIQHWVSFAERSLKEKEEEAKASATQA